MNEEKKEMDTKVEEKASTASDKNAKAKPSRNSRNRNKKHRNGGRKESQQKVPVRNNASMYITDPALAAMVSNISFNQFIGQKPIIPDNKTVNIPGFCTLLINPSPMWSDGNLQDGINMAGLKWYTHLSANNAKTTNYAPQDIMTLILAMGEVISTIEAAKRAIGLATVYNVRNRLFPKGAIRACGFDQDDLLKNLANYRIRLNTLINICNAIPIPNDEQLQYFKKCRTIYQTLFTDAESPMSQIYLFRQYSTWILDETSYDQGTILKTEPLYTHNSPMTMDAFLNTLEEMINMLLTSTTFNYIYADMLRVMDPSKLYTFTGVPDDYSVIPEFNPMMLLQIHNAEMCVPPSADTLSNEYTPSNDVYPVVATNSLRFNPKFSRSCDIWTHQRVVDFPHSNGNPTVDEIVDSTRYKVIGESSLSGAEFVTSKVWLADHYPVYVEITDGDQVATMSDLVLGGTGQMGLDEVKIIADLTKFDYAPLAYVYDTATDKVQPKCVVGDMDFFTTIPKSYLSRVNNLCAQG